MLQTNNIIRLIFSIIGVLLSGVSVAILKIADFGVDPFQTFMFGLNKVVHISYGNLYVIVNIILILFSILFCRNYIGLATIINLFLLGYVIDFSYNIISGIFLSDNITLNVRYIFIITGFVLLCFSSSLYMTANFGVSTYDAIALYIRDKGLLEFKYTRIMTDSICVILGFIMGYKFGVATIITALFMGPFVSFFNKIFSIPILKKMS